MKVRDSHMAFRRVLVPKRQVILSTPGKTSQRLERYPKVAREEMPPAPFNATLPRGHGRRRGEQGKKDTIF